MQHLPGRAGARFIPKRSVCRRKDESAIPPKGNPKRAHLHSQRSRRRRARQEAQQLHALVRTASTQLLGHIFEHRSARPVDKQRARTRLPRARRRRVLGTTLPAHQMSRGRWLRRARHRRRQEGRPFSPSHPLVDQMPHLHRVVLPSCISRLISTSSQAR